MPIAAVTMSMRKIGTSARADPSPAAAAQAKMAPAVAGAISAIADWMDPLTPFTRSRCRVGTTCGISADIAGIWMPAPADRIARAA